jgi:hypothetical protein
MLTRILFAPKSVLSRRAAASFKTSIPFGGAIPPFHHA